MHQHPDAPTPGPSTTAHRLPSGAVQVGNYTVAARPGRVYLAEEGEPGGLQPAAARALAAALVAAAGQAERAQAAGDHGQQRVGAA
jgi:hypothetical protein